VGAAGAPPPTLIDPLGGKKKAPGGKQGGGDGSAGDGGTFDPDIDFPDAGIPGVEGGFTGGDPGMGTDKPPDAGQIELAGRFSIIGPKEGGTIPPNAPPWWRPLKVDLKDPEEKGKEAENAEWNQKALLVGAMNSVLPFMSPEDMRTTVDEIQFLFPGSKLFQNYGTLDQRPIEGDPYGGPASEDDFAAFQGRAFPKNPETIDAATRNLFTSKGRAENLLASIRKFAAASSLNVDQSEGVRFLVDLAQAQHRFGSEGGEGQSSLQASRLETALKPLIARGQGDLAPFLNLANMIVSPTFTAGDLRSPGPNKGFF
jgi:hypothetical protein